MNETLFEKKIFTKKSSEVEIILDLGGLQSRGWCPYKQRTNRVEEMHKEGHVKTKIKME